MIKLLILMFAVAVVAGGVILGWVVRAQRHGYGSDIDLISQKNKLGDPESGK